LQDIFLPPSRLSIETLRQQYFLPSSLSKYEQVKVSVPNSSRNLGVHYLEYSNTTPQPKRFDAIYVNHGFGASSLSWLPALPSLVQRLGARVGLGHDAIGFGFTDRPDDVQLYTTGSSATIGTQLLLQNINSSPKAAVALFGHSLGALTTLKMALKLPKETSKFIFLSAPALGLSRVKKKKVSTRQRPSLLRRVVLHPVGNGLRKAVAYPVGGYVLRRIVG
jgi:pimeloyl-ACP methyl ester carboxylesterase